MNALARIDECLAEVPPNPTCIAIGVYSYIGWTFCVMHGDLITPILGRKSTLDKMCKYKDITEVKVIAEYSERPETNQRPRDMQTIPSRWRCMWHKYY